MCITALRLCSHSSREKMQPLSHYSWSTAGEPSQRAQTKNTQTRLTKKGEIDSTFAATSSSRFLVDCFVQRLLYFLYSADCCCWIYSSTRTNLPTLYLTTAQFMLFKCSSTVFCLEGGGHYFSLRSSLRENVGCSRDLRSAWYEENNPNEPELLPVCSN